MFDLSQDDAVQRMRAHMRRHASSLPGTPDMSGIELVALVRMTANLYSEVETQPDGLEGEVLSGPRFGVLMRLYAEEQHGREGGVTPTFLSRCQNVSKNTISSLLRGLEEQGYIERQLDAQDLRVFRIQLSTAGRDLVRSTLPGRITLMSELASELDAQERELLIGLLHKLYQSIHRRGKMSPPDAGQQPGVVSPASSGGIS